MLDVRQNPGSIPGENKVRISYSNVYSGSGAHVASCSVGTGTLYMVI
jgi:hypothetical protein